MKSHILYRILSYILLPFGGLLAFNALQGLIVALANPWLLIVIFIIACVPIYIFTSSYFFFNGVMKARPCKYSLKEWIKANAVVSIIFTALMLVTCLVIAGVLSDPQLLGEMIKQMKDNPAMVQSKLSTTEVVKIFKVFLAFMTPLGLMLLVHIIFTFRLLKQYKHVFDKA